MIKISFALFITLFSYGLFAQEIGSKVSFVAVDGKTYTGSIIGKNGDKFDIKYDTFDFKAVLKASQFKVINPEAAPAPPSNSQINKNPNAVKTTNNNVPNQSNLAAWMDQIIAKPAPANSDGAVTYEIKSFQVGTARKWQYNDGGNPANGHNTTVYPVKVRFIQKTHYRTRTYVIDRQCVFTSFKDSFGEWTFGYSSAPHIDKTYDEPADI
jgi:hypothetical protein